MPAARSASGHLSRPTHLNPGFFTAETQLFEKFLRARFVDSAAVRLILCFLMLQP
jgi:hypothetical protein